MTFNSFMTWKFKNIFENYNIYFLVLRIFATTPRFTVKEGYRCTKGYDELDGTLQGEPKLLQHFEFLDTVSYLLIL